MTPGTEYMTNKQVKIAELRAGRDHLERGKLLLEKAGMNTKTIQREIENIDVDIWGLETNRFPFATYYTGQP